MEEIENLKKLGLTEYEGKIVMALIKNGPSKVSEIYKDCFVPKNKIYESIPALIKKGILESLPTTPKKYLIRDLESLNVLVTEKEREIANLKQGLEDLKDLKSKGRSSSRDIIWINYGTKSFLNKIKNSIEKLNKENLIIPTKLRDNPVIMRQTESAIKRGVKVKILAYDPDPKVLMSWRKMGAKIRLLKQEPNITFSTFDDSLCRINLEIKESNDPTLWIEDSSFIQILKERFNSLWKISKR